MLGEGETGGGPIEDLVGKQILHQEARESAFLTGSRRCCWSTERTLSSEQGGEVLLLLVCDSRVFLPLSCWCELGSAGPRKGTVSSEF